MSTIALPPDFGYVGAALLSTVFLLLGQNIVVGRYRQRAGIKYPQLYAEQAQVEASNDALLFNCAQRAHHNTLEYIPMVHVLTLLTSLKYPIVAASICGLWTISRISYTRGYLTGNPSKRASFLYRIGVLGAIGLFGTAIYVVGDLIVAGR